ncbi:MAG: dynamin family protein [Paracoccaceae bacterium]
MNISEHSDATNEPDHPRKPRIAIMGEFSVGKSTLSNLLLGSTPLPVKVTATQLPPVWVSFGNDEPYREDLDGEKHPIDLEHLQDIPLDDTAVVRIFLEAEILENCDLIDMPGISDPNMPPEVWEPVVHFADAVLWCTHATQAWRQSEAAVWKTMPQNLISNSLLLITRIDKILTERDRNKVIRRVCRETKGLFAGVFPISLTQALAGQDDPDKWAQSGAKDFSQALNEMTEKLAGLPAKNVRPAIVRPVEPAAPARENNLRLDNSSDSPAAAPGFVRPSRVRVATASGRHTQRPEARPHRVAT